MLPINIAVWCNKTFTIYRVGSFERDPYIYIYINNICTHIVYIHIDTDTVDRTKSNEYNKLQFFIFQLQCKTREVQVRK